MRRRSFLAACLLAVCGVFGFFVMSVCQAGPADGTVDDTRSVDTRARSESSTGPDLNVIGPQNLIQIKIFGEADANQIYRVDEQGYIRHALIGRIRLGGQTVEEAERLLESTFSGDYYVNPRVSVFVLEHSYFSILGEVRRPGTFELTGRVSVIKAISMAGGFTPVANQRAVKITRKLPDGAGETTFEVDTTQLTGGNRSAQTDLQAEDVVLVPKSFW